MSWRKRTVECAGSALFRGAMPPRLGEFAAPLKAARVTGKAVPAGPDQHWAADLAHPSWGAARVVCLRGTTMPPAILVDFDPHLDAAERAAIKSAGSLVGVTLTGGGRGDVLRDRKALLRWLRLLMGDDGLAAMDHTAQRFWSRAALDDELAHDADLDVESLFVLHAVTADESTRLAAAGVGGGREGEDGRPPVVWLHTHGLAEIGVTDFDVLAPHHSVVSEGGFDALRALAFALLEGKAKPGAETYRLAGGATGGGVRLVEVPAFNRRAAARDRALRLGADDGHTENRVVVCDPPGGGLLGRWFDRPRPCRWLQREVGEGGLLVFFTDAATDLGAARARATWGRFGQFIDELAEFEFNVLAKIGYPTDTPGGGRGHLWFQVHRANPASADATLLNSPFDIAGMRAGDRAEHPIDRLTDWAIVTPFGMANPRNTTPVRRVRENRDLLRKLLRESRDRGGT